MAVNDADRACSVELPDLDSAAADGWAKREYPIRGSGSRNRVQVVLKRSVLSSIHEHGLSRTDVEVCGVMIGQCYQDERGPFVYIEDIIQGNHSESQVAQVTFTAETWNHIQNEMDKRFEDKRILGWYHTHPGFGIFLSEMDMFIHENFFSGNEQLAFVYDPLGGQEGLFLWRGGQAIQDHCLVEEDAGMERNSSPRLPRSDVTAAAPPNMEAFADRLRRIERRQRWMAVVLCLAVVLAIVWPFACPYLTPPQWKSPPPLSDQELLHPVHPIKPPTRHVVPEVPVNPLDRKGEPGKRQYGPALEVGTADHSEDARSAETLGEIPPAVSPETQPKIELEPQESLAPNSENPPATEAVPETGSTAVPEANPETVPAAGEEVSPDGLSTAETAAESTQETNHD